MKPRKVSVRSIEEFLQIAMNLPRQQWVFRGHSYASWEIESTAKRFFRHNEKNIYKRYFSGREMEAVRKFQRTAHQFLNLVPDESDTLGWLTLMRHYGAPTRLIDFTYSPITALFFAYSDQLREFERSACVHAIQVDSVMMRSLEVLQKKRVDDLAPNDFFGNPKNDEILDYVALFDGKWNTPRQSAQQGLFMVTSRIDTDVNGYLESCPPLKKLSDNEPWLIFEFPRGREFHRQVVRYLLSANQTHETLYPGLEGLAQSLAMKLYEPLPLTRRVFRGD